MSDDTRLIERALAHIESRITPIRDRLQRLLVEMQDIERELVALERERKFILEQHSESLRRTN